MKEMRVYLAAAEARLPINGAVVKQGFAKLEGEIDLLKRQALDANTAGTALTVPMLEKLERMRQSMVAHEQANWSAPGIYRCWSIASARLLPFRAAASLGSSSTPHSCHSSWKPSASDKRSTNPALLRPCRPTAPEETGEPEEASQSAAASVAPTPAAEEPPDTTMASTYVIAPKLGPAKATTATANT